MEINKLSYWNSQQQIPNCLNNSKIKENIYKLFNKLWHKQILEASEGTCNIGKRTYKKFKVNLNLEKLLMCAGVRAHTVALAKFRRSAHQLRRT